VAVRAERAVAARVEEQPAANLVAAKVAVVMVAVVMVAVVMVAVVMVAVVMVVVDSVPPLGRSRIAGAPVV